MPAEIPPSEPRSLERLTRHYLIEKELAKRLRSAEKNERRMLYATAYDELFRRVPDHPQITAKADPRARTRRVAGELRLLRPYLTLEAAFLELGAGDCALALEVAKSVRKAFVVDASAEITRDVAAPMNVEWLHSDGCSVPLPEGSIDIAYSNQLMEHLHPEDALEQLQNIHRALRPGGVYLCITPNRLSGPHDISKYFDDVATGFHLREYTAGELGNLFRAAGFSRVRVLIGSGARHRPVPLLPVRLAERTFAAVPLRFRRRIALRISLGLLRDILLIATR